MTFPAWNTFDGDRRVKGGHVRVYRECRKHFDFRDIRGRKLEILASESGLHFSRVSRHLDDLVHWGYLVEHERDRYGGRQFTLAWSVAEALARLANARPLASGE